MIDDVETIRLVVETAAERDALQARVEELTAALERAHYEMHEAAVTLAGKTSNADRLVFERMTEAARAAHRALSQPNTSTTGGNDG